MICTSARAGGVAAAAAAADAAAAAVNRFLKVLVSVSGPGDPEDNEGPKRRRLWGRHPEEWWW